MDNAKYITFKRASNGWAEIVVFSHTMKHDEFLKSMRIHPSSVVGAGFIRFRVGKDEFDCPEVQMFCYGESISLNIKSHIDDSAVAQQFLIPNS